MSPNDEPSKDSDVKPVSSQHAIRRKQFEAEVLTAAAALNGGSGHLHAADLVLKMPPTYLATISTVCTFQDTLQGIFKQALMFRDIEITHKGFFQEFSNEFDRGLEALLTNLKAIPKVFLSAETNDNKLNRFLIEQVEHSINNANQKFANYLDMILIEATDLPARSRILEKFEKRNIFTTPERKEIMVDLFLVDALQIFGVSREHSLKAIVDTHYKQAINEYHSQFSDNALPTAPQVELPVPKKFPLSPRTTYITLKELLRNAVKHYNCSMLTDKEQDSRIFVKFPDTTIPTAEEDVVVATITNPGVILDKDAAQIFNDKYSTAPRDIGPSGRGLFLLQEQIKLERSGTLECTQNENGTITFAVKIPKTMLQKDDDISLDLKSGVELFSSKELRKALHRYTSQSMLDAKNGSSD